MSTMRSGKFVIHHDLSILKQLGCRSRVWLCKERATHRLVVLKRYALEEQEFFEQEVTALCELAATNIVPSLYFAEKQTDHFVVGIQYISGRPLKEYVRELPSKKTVEIAATIDSTIEVVHANGISHGDLGPSNMLVCLQDNTPSIKIIDWEYAQKIRDDRIENYQRYRGTRGYVPEGNVSLIDKDLSAKIKVKAELGIDDAKTKVGKLKRFTSWI